MPPSPPPRPRRRILLRLTLSLALGGALAACALAVSAWRVWREPLDLRALLRARLDHGRIDDRNGVPLLYLPNAAGFLGHDVELASLPPCVPAAFLAAEDARFFDHPGLDPRAILRAAFDNARSLRVVSGASTIAQQVVRRMFPRDRSLPAKFREAVRALKISRRASKERLLSAYLNLVPMGGEIEGVGLASRTYFGKPPESLVLSEAAALAALPKAPSRYLPRTAAGERRLRARRDRILARMERLGMATAAEVAAARAAPVAFASFRPRGAPSHFTAWVAAREGEPRGVLSTTLDARTQAALEATLSAHRDRLARLGISQAAGVIASAPEMTIAAMAGSLGYGPRDAGYVNGALARRSAGSILKPFLYAAALEEGRAASSLLADTVERYRTPAGDYLPLNATRAAYGPVTMRTALGNSLNLSAVRLLSSLEEGTFLRRLARLNLASDDRATRDRHGLGIAIGNLEVSPLALAEAYGVFARGGRHRALAWRPGMPRADTPVFDPRAVHIVNDILADPTARLLTFGTPSFFALPYPVILKTGTSTRSRDAWLASVNPRHVIVLWAGNFDGRATSGAGGAAALGPVLRDLLRALYPPEGPGGFARPAGIVEREVCGWSGRPPSGHCPSVTRELFLAGCEPEGACEFHEAGMSRHLLDASYVDWNRERVLRGGAGNFAIGGLDAPGSPRRDGDGMPPRIVAPRDGDRFVIDPFGRNEIRLQAETRVAHPELIWFLDGQEIGRTGPPYRMIWRLARGTHTIAVATPQRARAAVTIRVE